MYSKTEKYYIKSYTVLPLKIFEIYCDCFKESRFATCGNPYHFCSNWSYAQNFTKGTIKNWHIFCLVYFDKAESGKRFLEAYPRLP